MTDQTKTLKAFRVEPQLWTAALSRATTEGRSLSEVIRQALRDYVGTSTDEA